MLSERFLATWSGHKVSREGRWTGDKLCGGNAISSLLWREPPKYSIEEANLKVLPQLETRLRATWVFVTAASAGSSVSIETCQWTAW